MDKEYADDTALYTAFSIENINAQKSALDVFCLATGARINWRKSCGFLVGTETVCTWGMEMGFTWIPPGRTCRYLGFQVGIDATPEQQYSPVFSSIRKKLVYWSSCNLSLAGRALVANQVLLATTWYIASCWLLHSGILKQLSRLIRNFLWSASDGTQDTRARVKWSTVIMAKSEGGLRIIDP